jgi:hypothetical protein
MLKPNERLAPNTSEVADEVIDGEAILINLATGIYYSMDCVGSVVWSLIAAGHRLEDVATTIATRYEVSPEQAEADVQRLAAELVEHRLVVPRDGDAPDRPTATPVPTPKLPYEEPKLTVYRDMGDLLALDPPAPGLQDIPWTSPGGKPRG